MKFSSFVNMGNNTDIEDTIFITLKLQSLCSDIILMKLSR